MNPTEHELESVLRCAPQPQPPATLKTQLVAQVKLPVPRPASQPPVVTAFTAGWFRRWWLVLVPATISLVCIAVLAVQQMEISDLKETIRVLSEGTAATEAAPSVATPPTRTDTSATDSSAIEQQEIARLKQLADQLAAEVAQLEQTQSENQSLRVQLATPRGLTAEELDAMTKAREKALSMNCIANLKQFGLRLRMWALDHQDVNPPDIVCMSNELRTPKILVCPADTNRTVAVNFTAFTSANCSYDYLAPSRTNHDLTDRTTSPAMIEPNRVLSRCPIHGHIGLCDGSVQGEVARNHPEWLVERDGKLYCEPNAQPSRSRPAAQSEGNAPIPNR